MINFTRDKIYIIIDRDGEDIDTFSVMVGPRDLNIDVCRQEFDNFNIDEEGNPIGENFPDFLMNEYEFRYLEDDDGVCEIHERWY